MLSILMSNYKVYIFISFLIIIFGLALYTLSLKNQLLEQKNQYELVINKQQEQINQLIEISKKNDEVIKQLKEVNDNNLKELESIKKNYQEQSKITDKILSNNDSINTILNNNLIKDISSNISDTTTINTKEVLNKSLTSKKINKSTVEQQNISNREIKISKNNNDSKSNLINFSNQINNLLYK